LGEMAGWKTVARWIRSYGLARWGKCGIGPNAASRRLCAKELGRNQDLWAENRARLRVQSEQIAGAIGRPSVEEIEANGGAQSRAFMIEMLPHIWSHLRTYPAGSTFTVLDVGPGAGYGSELLASLHNTDFLGYRLVVDTVDLSTDYADVIRFHSKFIRNNRYEDIFEMSDTYDIVIASHVIEHVENPLEFVNRLREFARQRVFVYAPFDEPQEALTPGHISVLDKAFLANFNNDEWTLVHSIAWGAFLDPPYQCLLLNLPGYDNR